MITTTIYKNLVALNFKETHFKGYLLDLYFIKDDKIVYPYLFLSCGCKQIKFVKYPNELYGFTSEQLRDVFFMFEDIENTTIVLISSENDGIKNKLENNTGYYTFNSLTGERVRIAIYNNKVSVSKS